MYIMKYYKYLIFCLFSVLLFSSCFKEQKELFDLPSDERVRKYINDFENVITDSPNGWIMDYFPNSGSEGYSLIMLFNKDKSVEIAGMNQWSDYTYITDISMWDVISDDNPVLTFNTYNKVFHLFSNPEDPDGTSSLNGIGLEGDYEFNIISYSGDIIKLKGKKHNATIMLNKLSSSDWEALLTNRIKMSETLFSPVVKNLSLNYNGEQIFRILNPSSHILTLENTEISIPFIITDTGIKLYSPLRINDTDILTFNLDENKDKLVCGENPVVTITGEKCVDFILNYENWTGRKWKIVEYGGVYKDLFNDIASQCQEIFNEEFKSFSFIYSGARNGLSICFESGEYIGNVDIDMTNSDGKVLIYRRGTGDLNGITYLNKISKMKDFFSRLGITYFDLESVSGLNPTDIYMYDSSDRNNYIEVILTDL